MRRQSTQIEADDYSLDEEENARKIQSMVNNIEGMNKRMIELTKRDGIEREMSMEISSAHISESVSSKTGSEGFMGFGGVDGNEGMKDIFAQGLFENFKLDDDVLAELLKNSLKERTELSPVSSGRVGKYSDSGFNINSSNNANQAIDFLKKMTMQVKKIGKL